MKNIEERLTYLEKLLFETDQYRNSGGELPYKVYTALLSQADSNVPVTTVLENTLGGTPVWSRDSAGVYRITLEEVFVEYKTVVIIQRLFNFTNYYSFDVCYEESNFPNNLKFTNTIAIIDDPSVHDGVELHFIEIRVYP